MAHGENSRHLTTQIQNMWAELSDRQPSIYRVPQHLRKLNENAYTPWHVSIGPYHHKDAKYRVMEDHKLAYMRDLIGRTEHFSGHNQLVDYINKIQQVVETVRLCYAEPILLTNDEFAKLLLIDGCFIVEFLCRKVRKLSRFENEPTKPAFGGMYAFIDRTYNDWRPTFDFIFQSTRTSFEVRRDLILLENQLPYFVLEDIFKLTFPSAAPSVFHEIVYCALRTSIPNTTHIFSGQDVQNMVKQPELAHLVSVLKICCGLPATTQARNHQNQQMMDAAEHQAVGMPREFPCLCNMDTHELRVPSATALSKAGVEFRQTEGSPLLEIKFSNGVLEMPSLIMWHHTETFFRNIMAYELYNHTNDRNGRSVSDFMCFMDDLINSKEDVALLVRSGVIENWLESDEAVENMFNSITKHILADYSSYSGACKQLNNFRRTLVRRCQKVLRQDYFNEPWALTYFITGVLIQTIASIMQTVISFHSEKSS